MTPDIVTEARQLLAHDHVDRYVAMEMVAGLVAEVERLRHELGQRPPGDLLVTLNPDGAAARLLGGDQ